jgi:hypothetical protein
MTRFTRAATAISAAAVLVAGAVPLVAQQAQQAPSALHPSGRATVTVEVRVPRGATPQRISIDYGQPHARGRAVAGALIPNNQVWRLGANTATHLNTDVDLMIGSTHVPKGSYTLHLIDSPAGARLIVNRATGQWGVPYSQQDQELARIDMRKRTLSEPMESLIISLVPDARESKGVLNIIWGTAHYSVDWMTH